MLQSHSGAARVDQGFVMPMHSPAYRADSQHDTPVMDPRRQSMQMQQQQRPTMGSPVTDAMLIDQPGSIADSPSLSGQVQVCSNRVEMTGGDGTLQLVDSRLAHTGLIRPEECCASPCPAPQHGSMSLLGWQNPQTQAILVLGSSSLAG